MTAWTGPAPRYRFADIAQAHDRIDFGAGGHTLVTTAT